MQIIEAQILFQQARLGHVRAQAERYADSAQFFIATRGDNSGIAPPPIARITP